MSPTAWHSFSLPPKVFWFGLLVSPKYKRVQRKPSNNALSDYWTFLGMIWTNPKISKQQWFPARMMTAAVRLDGHKYCINVFESF